MRRLLHDIWIDEQALATVEYALLLVLVALAGLTAWEGLADVIGNMVGTCTNEISAG